MSDKLKIAPGNEPPPLQAGDRWKDETGEKMFDGEKVVSVPTPTIDLLFDAFCKQHGVVAIAVVIGRVTGTMLPAIDLLEGYRAIEIKFVKP